MQDGYQQIGISSVEEVIQVFRSMESLKSQTLSLPQMPVAVPSASSLLALPGLIINGSTRLLCSEWVSP